MGNILYHYRPFEISGGRNLCKDCMEILKEQNKSIKFTSYIPVFDKACDECKCEIKKFNNMKECLDSLNEENVK